MRAHELEELQLLLLRDAAEPPMWLDRWAQSYPTVIQCTASADQGLAQWQQCVEEAWQKTEGRPVMAVAHGCGVLALMAWVYQADIRTQKNLCGALLVAPVQAAWQEDRVHTLARARLNCPAALVVGKQDKQCPHSWASDVAAAWGARLLLPPQSGHLNEPLHGWQWGMRLMQEMVLSR